MHTRCLAFAGLFGVTVASAQHASKPVREGSNWQSVQALPAGTAVEIATATRHIGCKVQSVDADSLTCATGGKPVFQRTEVSSVKISHRARATLVGAAIGAGAGAIIGAAQPGCKSGSCIGVSKGQITGASIAVGAVIGAPIGWAVNFGKSTVYKAP